SPRTPRLWRRRTVASNNSALSPTVVVIRVSACSPIMSIRLHRLVRLRPAKRLGDGESCGDGVYGPDGIESPVSASQSARGGYGPLSRPSLHSAGRATPLAATLDAHGRNCG